jgi:hypothetical protein
MARFERYFRRLTNCRSKAPALILLLILVCTGLGIGSTPPAPAFAQEPEEIWETPVNLSHSGGAGEPILVIDASGVLHVIWPDVFEGFRYTRFAENRWSDPATVNFPFNSYRPLLVADHENYIHAFWLDEDGLLFHSRVNSQEFGNAVGWSGLDLLAQSAPAFDVIVDAQNQIHLAYLRALQTSEFPTGIYTKRSSDGGNTWTDGHLIYPSPYFRGLTAEFTNVQMASAGPQGQSWLYIAWDNRPRRQVYLAMSKDGGETWGEAKEVDRPNADLGSAPPSNISVGAHEEKVLLFWQNGDPIGTCIKNYLWSSDGGQTWLARKTFLDDIVFCSSENEILTRKDGLFLLMLEVDDQSFLVAWNGAEWSEVKGTPNFFIDPDTLLSVNYRCQEAALSPGQDHIIIVGCDDRRGDELDGDIWLTRGSLETQAEWFQHSSVWDPLTVVAAQPAAIRSPEIVADTGEGMHIFWSQVSAPDPEVVTPESERQSSIFYAKQEGGVWSRPGAVLKSPEGQAEQPAAAIDGQGRLLVVWSASKAGIIYFSWADTAQADNASEWAKPQALPLPGRIGRTPDIVVDLDGALYVAYTVPINDGRGIYVTRSLDAGQTWSKPALAFDGASVDWEMVDSPQLAVSGDGRLHLIWEKRGILAGNENQGLYYARSEDGGQTWSQAVEMGNKSISWKQIFSIGEHTLHRVWQESSGGSMIIWHDQSLDSGFAWSRPDIISSFLGTFGLTSFSLDRTGQLHLLQVAKREENIFVLQHSQWSGENWVAEEGFILGKSELANIDSLRAEISPAGRLAILYVGSTTTGDIDQPSNYLFYTERTVDLPGEPLVQPTPAPTAAPTLEPTQPSTPGPTPTLDLANLAPRQGAGRFPLANNQWSALILGAGLAAVLIAVTLGLWAFSFRYKR